MKNTTPYKCILPGCNRSFSRKQALSVHMISHVNNGLLDVEKVNGIGCGNRAENMRLKFSVPEKK